MHTHTHTRTHTHIYIYIYIYSHIMSNIVVYSLLASVGNMKLCSDKITNIKISKGEVFSIGGLI